MTLLDVHDLTVAYGDITAVRSASLTVNENELVVVLGANGAGKTTLLSALIGWLQPRTGTMHYDGRDLARLPPWQRAELGIGFVPEGGRVMGDLTVDENLRVAHPTDRGLTLALELFPDLAGRRHQVSSTLSGGQRQMLALARALAREPTLLVVDEASTGLMPTLVSQLFGVLADLRTSGLTILLVEQNTQAIDIADRGYVMAAGEIVRSGTADKLRDDPEIRRAYLGGT